MQVVFDYFYISGSEGNRKGSIRGAIRQRLPLAHTIRLPGSSTKAIRLKQKKQKDDDDDDEDDDEEEEEGEEDHASVASHIYPAGELLERGNVAVAISYAAMMVSYSILVAAAVYQSYELASFCVWLVGGGILLLVLRAILDRVVVPGVDLDTALSGVLTSECHPFMYYS